MTRAFLVSWLGLVTLAGCSSPATHTTDAPGLAFPHHLAEGSGDPDEPAPAEATEASKTLRAEGSDRTSNEGADARAEHRKRYGSLPDPTPLKTQEQWQLTLLYDRGALSLTGAEPRHLETPLETPRHIGRFAVELWIGHELIERVRFDFALVGIPPDPTRARPLAQGEGDAESTHTLLIPDSQRATRLVLVDRATGRETILNWPPDRPQGPKVSAASEGPNDAAAP